MLCLVGINTASAQHEKETDASIPLDKFYIKRHGASSIRKLISKLNWSVSTGTGYSFMRHRLNGFGILQNPGAAPVIYNKDNIGQGYSNWVNDSRSTSISPGAGSYQTDSDAGKIGFKSHPISIPIKGTLHLDFKNFRIGGGYSTEYMHIGKFKPLSHSDKINDFSPEKSSLWMKHYFGMIGVRVYRYYEYSLVLDANIGGYKLGKNFNMGLIHKALYYNFGATIERDLSEYFRAFVRPSYEIKSYTLSMPGTSQNVTHKFNAFYLNVGVTYRIPELRRCFMKECHAQLNHAHGNREYRSRRHPIYKKQNPHYGENYPVILKYKGGNKKKLNPY